MTSVGIIAEFNPFHGGHAYIINEARRAAGMDSAVVCVMSGSMVQRGEPAVFDKYSRAQAAILCGADLIIELPAPWSLGSAGVFADGAVGLLESTGAIDLLFFGSENGEIEPLCRSAAVLCSPEADEATRQLLKTGVSYAAAREKALLSLGAQAQAVSGPNNTLGIEYIRALMRMKSAIRPMTAARIGPGHDEESDGPAQSASSLRRRLCAGEDISPFVPSAAAEVFRRELSRGRGPISMEGLEIAILSRLRMLPEESFAALPGAAEGLERRFYSAICTEAELSGILSATKTKRYSMSRIRRMLMCACLGIKQEHQSRGVPYIRVLAAGERGRALLRRMNKTASIPIVTKPACLRALGGEAEAVFELESAASDFAALCFASSEDRRPGADWRHTPLML